MRKSVQEVLENALQGKETSNYKLEFRTKSDEIRYLLVNASTRRDDDHNIVGVVGVAQDVTESSKNDRAVAAMGHELRQLVDTANAPIFGIDVNGNVNERNNKTVDITGFTLEDALNRGLYLCCTSLASISTRSHGQSFTENRNFQLRMRI